MYKHIATMEGLAGMLQRTMASQEASETVTVRLDGSDARLDRIEHRLLAEQKRAIEELKPRRKRLKDALAV